MSIRTSLQAVRACALAGAMLVAGAAAAQPGAAPAAPQRDEAYPVTWSSPELERLGNMLTGVWKTDAAVATTAGDDAQVVLSIGPVGIEGMPNALYCEAARADALHAPYRQAVYELFEYRGKIRLRTYEFHNSGLSDMRALVGAWASPAMFPPLEKSDFIATLDVEGTLTPSGFTGATPAPYPTAVGGAVEMTSQIELTPSRMVTQDRGFDATGAIVWGQESGGQYVFSKVQPDVKVTQHPDGLVVLEYRSGAGEPVKSGDTFSVHYSGWFSRNASVFDSSRTRGLPYTYQYPGTMIEGFHRGTEGMSVGTLRRIYIPYTLGYGETGQPPRMPGRSNLIFELECVSITPAAAPAAPATPARPAGDADASDSIGG